MCVWNWWSLTSSLFVPYAMSHLYHYWKKHKHFSLSRVWEGWRSILKSVKVAVVVSVSLHHQQCDNFHKMRQENSKWTGAIIYMWRLLPFRPLGPPLKACTTLQWGPQGRVHCKVDSVWTGWPGPLWKISSLSEAFEEKELLNAWPLDDGQSSCQCDSPGLTSKPPSSSELQSLRAPAL